MVKCALKIFSGHIRPWTQHREKTPFSLNEPVQPQQNKENDAWNAGMCQNYITTILV